MRDLAAFAILASFAGAASAQVTFFTNDQAGFDAAVAGASPLGVLEDFENNDFPDGQVTLIIGPLQGGVPNGPFFEGLRNENLAVRAVDPAGNDAVDIALLTEGFIGPHTDLVGADLFANATQLESDVDLFAIEFDIYSFTGGNSTDFEVYNSNGDLIGSGSGPMNEPSHYGIVSENGDIAVVRIIENNAAGELVDNISMYVGEGGCFADCDGDGELTILDFVCYQGLFQSGDPGADCDGNGELNILDFVCFQNEFQQGCG
jgi:hypothetical protein